MTALCADSDKPATPEESSIPGPRLRVVLDGPPADVVALLRSMAQPSKGGGKRGPKLSAEVARVIRQRLQAGEQEAVLARELGVSLTSISNIRAGRTYGGETAST